LLPEGRSDASAASIQRLSDSASGDCFKPFEWRVSYDTSFEPTVCPTRAVSHECQWGVWHGTDALPFQGDWTSAQPGEKLFVWSRGFDWRTARQPYLVVTGKRLDGEAPAVAVAGGTNAGIGMLIGVSFPTAGCWELSVYHDGHVLTFVVSVGP
jgi:hypothetical protein